MQTRIDVAIAAAMQAVGTGGTLGLLALHLAGIVDEAKLQRALVVLGGPFLLASVVYLARNWQRGRVMLARAAGLGLVAGLSAVPMLVIGVSAETRSWLGAIILGVAIVIAVGSSQRQMLTGEPLSRERVRVAIVVGLLAGLVIGLPTALALARLGISDQGRSLVIALAVAAAGGGALNWLERRPGPAIAR
jgi:hypothetical protein